MYTQKKREVSYQDQSRIIWSALNDMKSILCKIEPHLIGKREQAKLALWWLKKYTTMTFTMTKKQQEIPSSQIYKR